MTSAEFKALFPEFAASSYDTRINTLLAVVPELDAGRAGNQLTLALGYWVADKLSMQDITITYGSASSSASSSTTTEKRVGDVSIKRGISNSAGSGSGGGAGPGQTTYGARYEALIREFGLGAVAV